MRHVLSAVLAAGALAAVIGIDASGNPMYAWGYQRGGYHARHYAPRYYGTYRYYGYPPYYYYGGYGSYGRYRHFYRHHYRSHHRWHRHWRW
jgi:hypothetical protein